MNMDYILRDSRMIRIQSYKRVGWKYSNFIIPRVSGRWHDSGLSESQERYELRVILSEFKDRCVDNGIK